MVKKLARLSKSVVATWILSYIIILIIPMIMNVIIYGITVNMLEIEEKKNSSTIINQLHNQIDSQLDYVNKVALQITFMTRIQSILYEDINIIKPDSYQLVNTLNLIAQDLSQFSSINNYFKECFIFLRNDNVVIAPGGIYDGNEYLMKNYNSSEYGNEFRDWISGSKKTAGFGSVTYINKSGARIETVAYFKAIPAENLAAPAVFALVLDETRINAIFAGLSSSNGGEFYLTDSTGRIIFPTYLPAGKQTVTLAGKCQRQRWNADHIS